MAVIDLRDDPRVDMQMAQNIGQGLGAAFGAYRRHEAEKALISIINQGVAQGKTPEQIHEDLLADKDARRSTYGTYAEQDKIEKALGIGRYDPAALEKQRLDTERTRSQIDSTNALTKARNEGRAGGGGTNSNDASFAKGQAIYNKALNDKNTYELTVKNNPGMKINPKVVEQFERQMKVGLDMQNRYSLPQQQTTRAPGPPIGLDDSTALGYPPQQPQGGSGRPGIFNQSPPATPVATQPPSTAGNMGPPVTEAIRSRPYFENVPYRQPEADVRGLPQPTPQQAKADAAIAEIVAPETELAPSTQAQPQSGQYVKKAFNSKTGQWMGFNGREWVPIQ